MDDILDELGNPKAVRSDWIHTKAIANGEKDRDIRRKMSNAMGRYDYQMLRSTNKDGRWKIGGKKVLVFVKPGLAEDFNPVEELKQEPF